MGIQVTMFVRNPTNGVTAGSESGALCDGDYFPDHVRDRSAPSQ